MDRTALRARLFAPVSAVPLGLFRIVFGLCLLWTVGYFLKGHRIEESFTEASFHFTYFGFDWVRPLGAFGMRALFWALGALAACVTVGLFSRASALLFGLGFGYAFLIDRTNYVNHNYLFALLALLLAWTPGGAALSLDELFRGRRRQAPAWSTWLFRLQFGVVYAFAGLAKMNRDWLDGWALSSTLKTEALVRSAPWIGSPATAHAMALAGLLFDLAVVPLLLFRRTRWFALAAAAVFHVMNDRLFTIGMFPWVMLAGTVCFFFDDVIAKLARRPSEVPPHPSPARAHATSVAIAAYAVLQLALPLRHAAYPGDVRWTEEGGTFSWQMMLDEKHAYARFFVTDPATGAQQEVTGANYLTPRQRSKVAGDPDMVLQFSRHIADEWAKAGIPDVEVRATAMVSLDGRPFQPLVDPAVDLAHAPRTLGHAPWIAPFPKDHVDP